uniref:hypothetical protein n=1 Tax=Limnohabitans sp. TaxID=1907725 RepID=UPI00404791D2
AGSACDAPSLSPDSLDACLVKRKSHTCWHVGHCITTLQSRHVSLKLYQLLYSKISKFFTIAQNCCDIKTAIQ